MYAVYSLDLLTTLFLIDATALRRRVEPTIRITVREQDTNSAEQTAPRALIPDRRRKRVFFFFVSFNAIHLVLRMTLIVRMVDWTSFVF